MKIKVVVGILVVSLFLMNCKSKEKANGIQQLSLKYCAKLKNIDAGEESQEKILTMMIEVLSQ